ncbi:deoxyribonuclease V [Sphaerisporangium flaviroseum]|uniref:deoxyribonuclease V n=1 Tax=Sphaerisporangium flaviroseum TaxID=509199 RepID=UPI0031EFDF56
MLQEPWPTSVEEALALQERLRTLVTHTGPSIEDVRRLGGLDVSYSKDGSRLSAAVVVLDMGTLNVEQVTTYEDTPKFGYVPGLFSFREAPPLLAALENVDPLPDVLLCDGHGIAHPRRFGLACHIGVITGIPTIGVAKQAMIGHYEEPDGPQGSWSPLMDAGKVIGRALRTADNVKPVFVSIGHKISLDTACDIVVHSTPKYRIPQPIRLADQASRHVLRAGTVT